MVTICKAGFRRGLKCVHKANTESPDGIESVYCKIGATKEQCEFALIKPNWEKKAESWKLSEKVIV